MDARVGVAAGLALVLALATATAGPARAYPRQPGVELEVSSAAELHAALRAAQPGDTITLLPGATYHGPFVLFRKAGDGWISLQASSRPRGLPEPGTRIDSRYFATMPKLVASSGPVVTAESGAHGYRFIGIEIAPAPGVFVFNVVQLGSEEAALDDVPRDFVFDRCYIHGDPQKGSRRGLALNSASTTVTDSYLSDFKEVGSDSQAIAGWNGPGPFRIINNYLEASGENIMFGGADPSIDGLVPSDIEIRRNRIAKPVEWQIANPRYAGTPWTVKNLLELKNARRVVIDSNTIEYNWLHAQNGFAILFTVRNQDGHAPWSVVEDVTFTNNVVRHVGSGMSILGEDDIFKSQRTKRILIRNNLFADVGGSWGSGRLFQLLNGTEDVVIDHNTGLQADVAVFGGDTTPHPGFVFTNNIVRHNEYGIIGSGTGIGLSTISRYFPGAVIEKNVFIQGRSSDYPGNNFFPRSESDVRFVDSANYRLSTESPYRGAGTDGKDVGADQAALIPGTGQARPRVSTAGTESVPGLVLWAAVALLAYTYAGYPTLAVLSGALVPRPVRRRAIRPKVTVVVVAHNEAESIAGRIENILALDYPRDRLDIVVASDGSTDRTIEVARSFGTVKVAAFRTRRGKPSVLNDVVPTVSGDIVVLADARQRFAADAVTALVENFADPMVGAVSGELMLVSDPDHAAAGDGSGVGLAMYWSFEKMIRRAESLADSTVGATGAIYGIRRDLYERLDPDTLLDDVVLPMRIVHRGYRVLFDPRARAYDRPMAEAASEFQRKVRTIGGTFQWFARERWVANPLRNPIWLQTISHKGLRLVLPILYAAVLVANLFLLSQPVYRWMLMAQVVFYGAGLTAHWWPAARRRVPILIVPYTIGLLTCATVVACIRYVTGRQQVTWEMARRPRLRMQG